MIYCFEIGLGAEACEHLFAGTPKWKEHGKILKVWETKPEEPELLKAA